MHTHSNLICVTRAPSRASLPTCLYAFTQISLNFPRVSATVHIHYTFREIVRNRMPRNRLILKNLLAPPNYTIVSRAARDRELFRFTTKSIRYSCECALRRVNHTQWPIYTSLSTDSS